MGRDMRELASDKQPAGLVWPERVARMLAAVSPKRAWRMQRTHTNDGTWRVAHANEWLA